MGVTYVDLDQVVVRAAGRSVPKIFEAEGESGFRDRERHELAALLEASDAIVVSTGGGVVSDARSRALLGASTCVWLTASIATLTQRCAASGEVRPLLAGDPAARLAELSGAREAWYREVATVAVVTDGRSVDEVVDEVVVALGRREVTR
jgi:shikimate kinase